MGRHLKSCVLLVALGLACETQAGDRKSAGTEQATAKAILVAPAARAAAPAYERPGAAAVGLFETGYSTGHRSSSHREDGAGPKREPKPLTLFHVSSKFGEIAVQPVIGKVNGAQFSVGF